MKRNVTVQIKGKDVFAGVLHTYTHHGGESASFQYDDTYLHLPQAFALSPDLPLTSGTIHTQGKALFGAFQDCTPDRWGKSLILHTEMQRAAFEKRAAKHLFECDYLVNVNDGIRQGAIRIWPDETPLPIPYGAMPHETSKQHHADVSHLASIPYLLSCADKAADDPRADISDLVAAGSALGGARPKASVSDSSGNLFIVKFPKCDEKPLEDVCAWEKTALDLASLTGIRVPKTNLMRVGARSVLLLRRFDRCGIERIPYISGLTAVQGSDGGKYSYLDLVSFIEKEGSNPSFDLPELWKRILFSCAIGNTDDHMRNHGFLREDEGWRLSPAFDINPTPGDHDKYLRTAIGLEETTASPRYALEACEWFHLGFTDARNEARRMADALSQWRRIANKNGISKQSQERMASCFESGIERLLTL